MPISSAVMVLGVLLTAASAAAQSRTQPSAVSGSAGVFGGSLAAAGDGRRIFGGWLDISFTGWALGDIEVDVFESRERPRPVEECPYDDCTERWAKDADGTTRLISDPRKKPAPATESNRFRGFSAGIVRQFASSRHAAPHFIVGFERLSRVTSFTFDDPAFDTRTYTRIPWGPVAGVGLDIFAARLVARVQYRVDPMPVGHECILVCNQQLRVGAGWAF